MKVFRISKVSCHEDGGGDQHHALTSLVHVHMLHLSSFVRPWGIRSKANAIPV